MVLSRFGGGGMHDPRIMGVSLAADAPIVNDTTLVNSNLVIALAANRTYYVRGLFAFTSDGAADSKVGFTTPTLSNSDAYVNSFTTNVTIKVWTLAQNGAYSADFRSISIAGYLQTSAAGNLVVQYAQQNLEPLVDTILRIGSFITAIEIERV